MAIFEDSKWELPPSWIVKIWKLNDGNGKEGQAASPCQIWSKLVKPLPRYGDFLDVSKTAVVRHVGFAMRVFGAPTNGTWWSLSPISSLERYSL